MAEALMDSNSYGNGCSGRINKKMLNSATCYELGFFFLFSLTWMTVWWLFGLKNSSSSIMRNVPSLQLGDNDNQRSFSELHTCWLMSPGGTDSMQISNWKRITQIHHCISARTVTTVHNRYTKRQKKTEEMRSRWFVWRRWSGINDEVRHRRWAPLWRT